MITEERLRAAWATECGLEFTERFQRFARAVEREARQEALEEAAKVADSLRGPIEIYNHKYPAMMDCAIAIRALKESP